VSGAAIEGPAVYRFEGFELDEKLYELRRGGEPVPLEPKVFDTLRLLVRQRDRVVSKRELVDELWADVAVTESVLTTTIASLRRALGPERERDAVVRTVYGRGYRFVADVEIAPGKGADSTACAARADRVEAFVGRAALLEQLSRAFRRALDGAPRLVLLTGEAGIGKTRTAEQFLACIGEEARTAVGRCHADEGAPPFWPWVQVLRTLRAGRHGRTADARDDDPGDMAELLLRPCVRSALASLPPEQARFRMFVEIAELLAAECRAQPVVLLLDDLQWADPASLGLLGFLLAELNGAALLIVATLRDEPGDPDGGEVLAQIATRPQCRRIPMCGFTAEETRDLLAAWLGRDPPGCWVSEFQARTGGNPLFLRETAQLLLPDADAPPASLPLRAAVERASRTLPKWLPRETSSRAGGLPESVRGMVAQRLRGLSAEAKRVLAAAAVVGDAFDLRLLAAVTGLDPPVLMPIVEDARAARLISARPAAPGRERFAHRIVREAVYEGLAPGARPALHLAVGEALESLHRGAFESILPQLAYHFHSAAPLAQDKAAVYAVRAARRATEMLAPEEAARHYERAVRAVELSAPGDVERRVELLLALGDAHHAAGNVGESRAAYMDAVQGARDLGDGRAFARAVLSFGFGLWGGAGADEPVRDLLREALERLGDRDATLRASLLSRLVVIGPTRDNFATVETQSRDALATARASRDLDALSEALLARHFVLQGPDHLDERVALADEISSLTETLGRHDRAFGVCEAQAADLLVQGDVAGFQRVLERSTLLLRESRHPWFHCLKAQLDASVALLRGRFDEGERRMHDSFAHAQRVQYPYANEVFLGQTLVLVRGRGQVGDIVDVVPSVVEQRGWMPFVRVLPAICALECGRLDEARLAFERLAAGSFGSLPKRDDWLACMVELAVLAHALGDTTNAAVLYGLLEPYARLHAAVRGVLLYAGPVRRALALLAASLGRSGEAIRHFEAALSSCEPVGAAPVAARIRFEYGSHLQRSGASPARARALVLDARTTASELGMSDLLRRCDARVETSERSSCS
jgi:DNA-binding winged helix-turn-helix (wHTH) protein/tetratricopeptide (TPR) repeat protein